MNKYLAEMLIEVKPREVEEQEIVAYKKAVIKEMKKLGASVAQTNLIREGAIKYAIINKRQPEDLAWAIMQ